MEIIILLLLLTVLMLVRMYTLLKKENEWLSECFNRRIVIRVDADVLFDMNQSEIDGTNLMHGRAVHPDKIDIYLQAPLL